MVGIDAEFSLVIIYVTYAALFSLIILFVIAHFRQKKRKILVSGGGKINPFIFPSETSTLLILIIVFSIFSVHLLSVNMRRSVSYLSPLFTDKFLLAENGILKFFILPFILFSILIYMIKPHITIKKEKLVDLKMTFPEIDKEIRNLADHIGLEKRFKLLYKDSSGVEIYTFGTHINNYIVLSKGFLEKFMDRKEEYRAILYHEIAHIVNGDIGKTELSLSFLFSFFILGGTCFSINIYNIIMRYLRFGSYLSPPQYYTDPITNIPMPRYTPDISLIYTLSTLIVILVWGAILRYLVNMILRYRELYADARAIGFLKEKKPLLNALTRFQAIGYFQKRRFGFISIPKRALFPSYHPPVSTRKEHIKNPQLFYDMGLVIPFIIGMIAFTFEHFFSTNDVLHKMTMNIHVFLNLYPFLYLPTFILAVFLLNPKLCSKACYNSSMMSSKLEPFFICQSYVLGFTIACYLIFNMPGLLQVLIYQYFLKGTQKMETYYYFRGYKLPGHVPTMGLYMGVLSGVAMLVIVLLSKWIVLKLTNCFSIRKIFKRPKLSLILVPSVLTSFVPILFLSANPLVKYLSVFIGFLLIAIPYILVKKFSFCPICKEKIEGPFDPSLKCTNCGFHVGELLGKS